MTGSRSVPPDTTGRAMINNDFNALALQCLGGIIANDPSEAINRWAIGSLAGGYQKAAAGSLTLYLQKDSPGKEVVSRTWKSPPLEKAKGH